MSERLDITRTEEPTERRKGFWSKLKRGLTMTHTEIIERIGAAASGRGVIEEETLEELEESLIAADLGVATTMELVDGVRSRVQRGQGADVVRLRDMLVDEVSILLMDAPRLAPQPPPRVTLVVGINGAGKTTSIAKLAKRSQEDGESVLLAAGDTFRAAAIDQLCIWGDRLDVDVVRQQPGSDPAAVVYDALQAALARGVDHVIVDTAGRLHTKSNLMKELEKIGRVVEREAPNFSVRMLLVLDATNGQNALSQAKEFSKSVPVDGLVLTKLDGTAKGGVVVAIAREMRLPVVHLGVGEQAEDLVDFYPRDFAAALFG
ncbi:MAG: signal recognition particle-docking protein FtsY [Acidobacteriota bacterium]